jgi:hypothetical protein
MQKCSIQCEPAERNGVFSRKKGATNAITSRLIIVSYLLHSFKQARAKSITHCGRKMVLGCDDGFRGEYVAAFVLFR